MLRRLLCINGSNSTWLSAEGLFSHRTGLTNVGLIATLFGKNPHNRFEYQVNTPLVLLMTERQDTWRFSFQGPVNLGLWGAMLLMGSTLGEKLHVPVMYLLLLPNSEHRVRLFTPLWVGAGCETQYFFARVNNADRGMLVTPYLSATFDFVSQTPELGRAWWRVSIGYGQAFFVNFDGDDSRDGAMLRIDLIRTGIFD